VIIRRAPSCRLHAIGQIMKKHLAGGWTLERCEVMGITWFEVKEKQWFLNKKLHGKLWANDKYPYFQAFTKEGLEYGKTILPLIEEKWGVEYVLYLEAPLCSEGFNSSTPTEKKEAT